MIRVTLQGGIGNQLFQIAFGVANSSSREVIRFVPSKKSDFVPTGDTELIANLSKNGYQVEGLDLPTLINKACNFVMREYSKSQGNRIVPRLAKLVVERYLRKHKSIERFIPGEGLGFFKLQENSELCSALAMGYFQTYRWAEESGAEIARIVELTRSKLSDNLHREKLSSIVVHVRRGDYDQEGFGFLGPTYYQNGLRILQRRIEAQQILLFSDDVFYAKKVISGITDLPIEIVEDPKDSALTTLRKMTGASGYVIANSSLSWWAAYLSEVPDGMVVAPDKWFKGFKDPQDLIPHNWIRINSNFL